jgi:hypothetical protein
LGKCGKTAQSNFESGAFNHSATLPRVDYEGLPRAPSPPQGVGSGDDYGRIKAGGKLIRQSKIGH